MVLSFITNNPITGPFGRHEIHIISQYIFKYIKSINRLYITCYISMINTMSYAIQVMVWLISDYNNKYKLYIERVMHNRHITIHSLCFAVNV